MTHALGAFQGCALLAWIFLPRAAYNNTHASAKQSAINDWCLCV